MATRSYIGIENKDGSVDAVYCHYDGYIEHNGKILAEHYTDPKRVRRLVNLGSLSILAPELRKPKGHSFKNRVDGHVVAYHRDRGEDLQIGKYRSAKHYFESARSGVDYLYLFKEKKWVVKSTYSSLETPYQDLSELVKGREKMLD